MRILLVSHSPNDPDGGASRVYHLLEQGLSERGHVVKALHYQDLAIPSTIERVASRLFLPRIVSRRAGREDLTNVDVVMSSSGMLYPLFERLRSKPSRPLLVNHLHGLAYFDHEATLSEVRRGHMQVSQVYRNVTGPLPVHYDEMGSRFADVTVVQNGRDLDFPEEKRWSPTVLVPLPLHPELLAASTRALPAERRPPASMLWFGSWVERKGRHYLPTAFERIAREHPAAYLTIGGTRMPAETLRRNFAPDVRDRIHVLPRVSREEQVTIFNNHAIFLFPSLSEGFGFALLEAMSQGLAVVTTYTGLSADLLKDNRNALIVPPACSLYLARAASHLIGDLALRRRVAAEGQALARTFTVEKTVSAYEAAFEQALASRRA